MGGTLCQIPNTHVVISFFFSEARKDEARRSLAHLRVPETNIHFTTSKNPRELVSEQDTLMNEIRPVRVFTHFYGDSHQEHRCVQESAVAATRKNSEISVFLWENNQPGARTHELFKPVVYNPIEESELECKIAALREHESQMVKYDTSRLYSFLKDKARIRGQECGHVQAEVFEPLKVVTTFYEKSGGPSF